jgi:hypothetical protein
MRLMLAFRVFFRVLFSASVAETVRRALDSPVITESTAALAPKVKEAPAPKQPARSEALTLLAALQREARFVDLVQEPLADYADAQIGAAARDVLRDCGKVLSRMFAIGPLATESEGAELSVPDGFDANRFRLVGNVGGSPPVRGKLVHHGWQATKCEVPAWTGGESAALVIAPVEVEIA